MLGALSARNGRHGSGRDCRRRAGELVELPGLLARVGVPAGLTLFEPNVALLAGLRDDQLVPRVSFFALDQLRRARARCIPRPVVAHEDLLVFRRGRA